MRSRILIAIAALALMPAAAAFPQAITEGFDDITTLPGAGWVQINHSTTIGLTNWFQGNAAVFPAQSGPPTSYIGANFNNTTGTNTISNWLLTPPTTLSNGSTLTFYTRTVTAPSFPDRLQVRMSLAGNGSDVGTTSTDVGTFTALLLDINPTYTTTGYPNAFTQFTVNITGVASPTLGRLAFRYFVENGGPSGANSDYIGIDTVAYVPNAISVAPISLAVDPTPGNGVLQVGELASVNPTWRNNGTAPVALTGATSGFTGPVGPVYTNPDAAADYGTIAVATNGSCTTASNCYTVMVTGTRPAVHWDSTILETVTPSATTKTWTLHVGDSFTDVTAANGFFRFVEIILHKGITGGCTATEYCPTSPATREQMAPFVLIAKEGAGYNPPACAPPNTFNDVPETSGFCKFIEELALRGVASGCGGNNYCPTDPVTREQMAIFALRTLDPLLNPPACGTPMFNDVPASSPFCRWIEELARRGVISGCGGGAYCPLDPVSRQQMSVFLSVTFGLTLYGL